MSLLPLEELTRYMCEYKVLNKKQSKQIAKAVFRQPALTSAVPMDTAKLVMDTENLKQK